MSSVKNDPLERYVDKFKARVQTEIDGNPGMMDLIAERQGEIGFENWADTLGLDSGSAVYAQAYVTCLEAFEADPDDFPINRAELRDLTAANAVLAAAGWDASDQFSEHFYAVDEAVNAVFQQRATAVNMEGPAKQVSFLLAEGMAAEDIVKLFSNDSPSPV
jgi:hypothetical protein